MFLKCNYLTNNETKQEFVDEFQSLFYLTNEKTTRIQFKNRQEYLYIPMDESDYNRMLQSLTTHFTKPILNCMPTGILHDKNIESNPKFQYKKNALQQFLKKRPQLTAYACFFDEIPQK